MIGGLKETVTAPSQFSKDVVSVKGCELCDEKINN